MPRASYRNKVVLGAPASERACVCVGKKQTFRVGERARELAKGWEEGKAEKLQFTSSFALVSSSMSSLSG